MFEQAGCAWCEAFDREIALIYPKTAEGQRAPLRRVNIDHALPSDLAFIEVERLTPLFVLADKGHGRMMVRQPVIVANALPDRGDRVQAVGDEVGFLVANRRQDALAFVHLNLSLRRT